jgi:hypothetical protein
LGSSEQKRGEVWVAAFLGIFKLLASRRLHEQHDIDSLHSALAEDQQTTALLSYRGHRAASRCDINHRWAQDLYAGLYKWSNEFEVRWLERNERRLSAVMPAPGKVVSPGDPLALYIARDHRAKDTRTARRIEQFRRRMESQNARKVRTADMVTYLGYRGPSMLQRVAREATNASETAITAVDRMLQCPTPDEFWRVVDGRRISR